MSQLRAQNHLYTVLEKGADGNQAIIVGAVHDCLNAKLDSLAAIIEKFCEPQVAIVSLTITEKGYCIDQYRCTRHQQSADYSRSSKS